MKVTVLGTGYVRLVTDAYLEVVPTKIKILNDGGIPIHDPGLIKIVNRTCTSRS